MDTCGRLHVLWRELIPQSHSPSCRYIWIGTNRFFSLDSAELLLLQFGRQPSHMPRFLVTATCHPPPCSAGWDCVAIGASICSGKHYVIRPPSKSHLSRFKTTLMRSSNGILSHWECSYFRLLWWLMDIIHNGSEGGDRNIDQWTREVTVQPCHVLSVNSCPGKTAVAMVERKSLSSLY